MIGVAFLLGTIMGVPQASAQQSTHISVRVFDANGGKKTFGDEVEKLEFVYSRDGHFAYIHIIERKDKTAYGLVHHWYNMDRVIKIQYRAHSLIGQGRIHRVWIPTPPIAGKQRR